MVGAGRLLTHPSGYSCASRGRWPMHGLFPALDIASPFTGMVLFVTRMSLVYDKNSINTIFTDVQ
jgi:hypothetical protein